MKRKSQNLNTSKAVRLGEILSEEMLDFTECLLLYIDDNGTHKQVVIGDVLREFDSKLGVTKHWKSHISTLSYKPSYRCVMCTYSTDYLHNLKAHHKECHEELADEHNILKCEVQKTHKLPNKETVDVSMPSLLEAEMYKCDLCNYKSCYKNNLKDHIKEHSDESTSSVKVKRHRKDATATSAEGKQNKDSIISQSIDGAVQSSDNKDSKNTVTQPPTDSNSQSTSSSSNSNSSQRSDMNTDTPVISSVFSLTNQSANDNSISCDFCQQTFTHKKLKKLHMENQHLDENGCYKCPKCQEHISHTAWMTHLSGHNITFSYNCTECGKLFKNEYNLKSHIQEVHEKSGLFKCPHCPKLYSRKSSLRDHIHSHTGVRPHLCEHCGAAYCRKSSLVKHVQAIHNSVELNESLLVPMEGD